MNRNPLRLALVLGVVVLALAAAKLQSRPTRGSVDAPRSVRLDQRLDAPARPPATAPGATRDPEVLPLPTTRDRMLIANATRCFMRAFVLYERGDVGRDVVVGLRHCATPRTVTELLRRPPLATGGRLPSAPARLGRLTGIRVEGDDAWAVVMLLYRERRSGVALELERAPGRFLVARVR